MKLVWSPVALMRLEELADFIALDDPAAATRWLHDLFDTVERLKDFPDSGRMVPEVGVHSVREVIYGAYRIIYRRQAHEIEVLTVRRGSERLRRYELHDG